MHNLDIDIDDTNLNPKSFKITDNSSWDANIEVKNLLLEITSPGFDYAIIFRVNKGFTQILNANLLKLNTTGLNELPTIPDGVYKIKFSADPNIRLNETYYYFRNIIQKNKYFQLLTNLLANRFNYTNKEFKEKKEKLMWLRELIEGSKYMAEDKGQVNKAQVMYKEINIELEKFKALC